MTVEQIVDVPSGGQITIQLPFPLNTKKKVKLTINGLDDTLESKVSLLKKAAHDKDFLCDMKEINKDFEFADSQIKE